MRSTTAWVSSSTITRVCYGDGNVCKHALWNVIGRCFSKKKECYWKMNFMFLRHVICQYQLQILPHYTYNTDVIKWKKYSSENMEWLFRSIWKPFLFLSEVYELSLMLVCYSYCSSLFVYNSRAKFYETGVDV